MAGKPERAFDKETLGSLESSKYLRLVNANIHIVN